MTPITRQDILAHQAVVPWAAQYQVEQDLLLCRAMAALFEDAFLSSQIAMRGGTLLHKVHLAPAARYSEDIDLVVVGTRPAEHIRRAIRRALHDVLGVPKASVWDTSNSHFDGAPICNRLKSFGKGGRFSPFSRPKPAKSRRSPSK